MFAWEQHAPGGCRCACQLGHGGHGTCLEPDRSACASSRRPRPWTAAEITDPLQICAACYDAIALLVNSSCRKCISPDGVTRSASSSHRHRCMVIAVVGHGRQDGHQQRRRRASITGASRRGSEGTVRGGAPALAGRSLSAPTLAW
ncbi:DUF6372 family protein [Kribbella aluminosa]|uniref:DUF6372 family protein n=1 Tax=Kribbella aluminosa TaxID=416017 RepID=UPI0035563EAF